MQCRRDSRVVVTKKPDFKSLQRQPTFVTMSKCMASTTITDRRRRQSFAAPIIAAQGTGSRSRLLRSIGSAAIEKGQHGETLGDVLHRSYR